MNICLLRTALLFRSALVLSFRPGLAKLQNAVMLDSPLAPPWSYEHSKCKVRIVGTSRDLVGARTLQSLLKGGGSKGAKSSEFQE